MKRFSLVIAILIIAASCAPTADQALRQRAQTAFQKAKEALLSDPDAVQIDVIWLLKDLLQTFPDNDLQKLADTRQASLWGHPMMIMLNPTALRIPLPEEPGRGIDRYYTYNKSAFGTPQERAIQYISEFLATKESGYILTHQLLALVWAEESGLELPNQLKERRKDLLKQIHSEQTNEAGIFYMDLYAERAALLLRYGKVPRRDAERWIERLIQMQNKDGNWPGTLAVLHYDGQFGSSLPPPPHTTVLAMTALRNYLDKY